MRRLIRHALGPGLAVLMVTAAGCQPDDGSRPAPRDGMGGGEVASDGSGSVDGSTGDGGAEGSDATAHSDGGSDAGCGPDQAYVRDACLACGPAGGCADTARRCVALCESSQDCADRDERTIPFSCADGVCRGSCF